MKQVARLGRRNSAADCAATLRCLCLPPPHPTGPGRAEGGAPRLRMWGLPVPGKTFFQFSGPRGVRPYPREDLGRLPLKCLLRCPRSPLCREAQNCHHVL